MNLLDTHVCLVCSTRTATINTSNGRIKDKMRMRLIVETSAFIYLINWMSVQLRNVFTLKIKTNLLHKK